MKLETALRQALKRKNPTGGFDDRVMSRLAAGEAARTTAATPPRRRVPVAIAAALTLTFGATFYVQQQQRRADEARARTASDVALALQIASTTVSAAQAKVEEMTRYESTNDR